jgi:hypothetical protein
MIVRRVVERIPAYANYLEEYSYQDYPVTGYDSLHLFLPPVQNYY